MNDKDQCRYDELFENIHHDLVLKVMELEDVVTDTDNQLETLQAENEAMREEIRSWNSMAKGHRIVPSGIGDMRYYFDKYGLRSKEEILVELMKREATMFQCGIIHGVV